MPTQNETGSTTGSTTDNAIGAAEIRQLIDTLIEALRAKDLERLRRLYATDVVSFDVEPPLQHVGLEAKLHNWSNVFTFFREVRYELRDLTLTVDKNVAFAHGFGRLSGTLESGETAHGMWVRATFGFRRESRLSDAAERRPAGTDAGGTWLIAHDQVSVPFDVRSGRGVADLEP